MALGFKAAQLGVAGLFSRSLLGSDIVTHNPFVKVMQNPIAGDGQPVVFVPALYPDVAIVHVHAADKYGNGRFFGPAVNDIAIAAAARKLIVTAEEIVPEADMRYNNKGVAVPFIYADAVVELPYGGVPGSMRPAGVSMVRSPVPSRCWVTMMKRPSVSSATTLIQSGASMM